LRCRHRICAEARLAVRARTAGLTAVDVDRALTDDRLLAVMWLNRGTRQQKQKAPKRLAKAKRDRRPTRRRSKRTGAWLGASPER
jgi:TfoX/Sxy family transcriptional regulator of competence genes